MHGSRRLLLLFALTILLPGAILAGVGIRALATPGAAAIVWGASPDDAWPPQALAYRQWDAPPSAPPATFRAAEDLELSGSDLTRAIEQYGTLLAAAKGDARAWLLHRVARSHRKAGNRDAAIRALDDLAQMPTAFVQGLPADFLARYERCAPPNGLPCEESDTIQLYRDFATGRWSLEAARYRAYSAQLRQWATSAGDASALVEIDATKARREALTEAVYGLAQGTRSSGYLVLQANDGGAAALRPALLLARDWRHSSCRLAAGASFTCWRSGTQTVSRASTERPQPPSRQSTR